MLKFLFDIRNKLAERAMEKRLYPTRLEFYKQFIQPGQLVFDVGANVGNRVKVFLALGAKVVAVEPQPSCQQVLKKQFGNNIIIEPVCLGESEYQTEMFISSESTLSTLSTDFIKRTGTQRFANSNWNNRITVQVTTLDKLITKHGTPAFCKIDVEGFEAEVLKGLTTNLSYISMEYCVPEMQDNLVSSINELSRIAPGAVFNYATGETMQLALPEWVNADTIEQLVASNTFQDSLFGDIYCKMQLDV